MLTHGSYLDDGTDVFRSSLWFGVANLAVAFVGLLFVAALSSAVSLMEVGVSPLASTTRWTRARVTAALTGVVFPLGLPSALGYSAVSRQAFGVPVLDWMDETSRSRT